MDESMDPKPHPHVESLSKPPHDVPADAHPSESLSIWFFCGILTLGYGIVLSIQGILEWFNLFGQHQPGTVLAELHPTFWWGVLLLLFGLCYTVKFRPGKG